MKEPTSLYRKYRPRSLKGVVGQDSAVASLDKLVSKGTIPHAILFTGPSGCGKTTLARILKDLLECGEGDFIEKNCADFRGVDDVREIRRHCNFAPLAGECRIFLIDEAHKLTNDAQNAILKLLEDTPDHVYFFLATTDPQKLIKTIHTRCTEVKLQAMGEAALDRVIRRVIDKEQMTVSDEVITEIAEAAQGSARKALVILEQVGSLSSTEEQMKAIQTTTFSKDAAIDLARKLLFEPNWGSIAKVLRSIKDEDAEGIRYCILGYARTCMVGSDTKEPNEKIGSRAFMVIDIFSENFYDSKHAGLAAACWEVVHAGRR